MTAAAGGETESQNFTLNVDNFTYTVSDSGASTSYVKKGTYYRSGSTNFTYLLDEDIVSKGASDRVVGDFGTGIAGTTYGLEGTNRGNFTIDSAGILSIKNYTGAPGSPNPITVSYTHLTLPTKRIV